MWFSAPRLPWQPEECDRKYSAERKIALSYEAEKHHEIEGDEVFGDVDVGRAAGAATRLANPVLAPEEDATLARGGAAFFPLTFGYGANQTA
jgi:hypothetical protein